MAYPNYFPQYYPSPYIPLQPMYQNQMSGANQPTQTMPKQETQTQNGGFIPVPSEQFARNYPVANGLSMTFKDENAPYVYTKTMGFNQLDAPVFTKYRLVKEEDAPVASSQPDTEPKSDKVDNSMIDDIKADMDVLREDVDSLWKEVDLLKKKPATRKKDEEA